MRMRSAFACGTVAVALLAASCAASDESIGFDERDTGVILEEQFAEPSEADVRDFRAAVERIEEFSAVRFSGSYEVESKKFLFTFESQLDERTFRGEIAPEGEGSEEGVGIEVLRASETTWVKSSEAYWQANGYDAESSRRADGKYVVFESGAGDQLADSYDYARAFRQLENMNSNSLTGFRDEGERKEYLFSEGGRSYVFSIAGESGLIESIDVAGQDGGVTTRIEDIEFVSNIDVEIPPSDEVVSRNG